MALACQENLPGRLQGDIWRPEEELKLLQLVRKGFSWKRISEEFPGRSCHSATAHYHKVLLSKIRNDPTMDKVMALYDRYNLFRSYYVTHY